MRIGIDASRYADKEATGVEEYSHQIINGLIVEILENSDHEIIFYSRKKMKIVDENVALLIKKYHSRVKFKVLKAKRLWTLFALTLEIWRDKPDLLFVPSHTFPLKLAKKNIIMIHDIAFRKFKRFYKFFNYLYLNWSTKYALKNADVVLVPTRATKKDICEEYKCNLDKLKVVHHGFSINDYSESDIENIVKKSHIFKYFKLTDDSKYFFYVGRLEAKKNLTNLVSAFAKFLDYYPEVKLILGGKRGVGFKEILKKVDELKINKHVIMPGYITEKEKAALYTKSVGFVFPSKYEGFGLPILEAFSFNKAVICSNVSCLPEVAGDASEYVDPDNVEDITTALKKIYSDANYSQELIRRGQIRLKQFSWKKSSKKTFKIINLLLKDGE